MNQRSVFALALCLLASLTRGVGGMGVAFGEDEPPAGAPAPTGQSDENGVGTRASPSPRSPTPRPAAHPKRPAHAHYVRLWHQPPTAAPTRTPEGRLRLVLDMINTGERIELSPQHDDGGFSDNDLERASNALRDNRTDDATDIDPRLLDLAYRLQQHFAAKSIRVLSAYRVARGRSSNHSRGRALDLIVPGHRDEEVAAYARTIGFVGVGIYPTSGFIHLDTRPRSFFWVDRSGPGQRNRTRPILGRLAAEADAKAIARGEKPPSDGDATDDADGEATNDEQVYATSTATSAPQLASRVAVPEGVAATAGGGGNKSGKR